MNKKLLKIFELYNAIYEQHCVAENKQIEYLLTVWVQIYLNLLIKFVTIYP